MQFSGTVEDGGGCGAAGEDSGGPFEETVAVEDELRECAEQRVDFEAIRGGFLRFWVEKDNVKVERDDKEGEDC